MQAVKIGGTTISAFSALSSLETITLFYCATPVLYSKDSTQRRKEGTEMLDLAFIRSNPDAVKEAARLNNNNIDIDYLLDVDRRVTTIQRQIEEWRLQQNQSNKQMQ